MKTFISFILSIIFTISFSLSFLADNLKIIDSEEEISKLIESSIFIAKIHRGCNEILIDRKANDYIIKNNCRYGKAFDKYQDFNNWKNFLYTTFSKELADVYLQYDMVINIDGLTYVSDGSMGTDELLDKYSYKIISNENGKVIVELCIPHLDGYGIINKYTKTEITNIDGQLLITYQDLNDLWLNTLDYENIFKINPQTSDNTILFHIIFMFILISFLSLSKKWNNTITQKRNK